MTQTGKVASCPGECIHAITSIFCDHVLEEVSCGQQYLRCCVPNDFSYGTPVETSPPLGHDIDKIYALTDAPHSAAKFTVSTQSPPDATSVAAPVSALHTNPFLMHRPPHPVKQYKVVKEGLDIQEETSDPTSIGEESTTDNIFTLQGLVHHSL